MSDDKTPQKEGPQKIEGVCCSALLLKKITAVLHRLPYQDVAPLMNEIHNGFRPVTYSIEAAPKKDA